MDRNTLIGIILIAVILVAYSLYNVKVAEERRKFMEEQLAADSTDIMKTQPSPPLLKTMPGSETEESEPGIITGKPDSSDLTEKLVKDFGIFHEAGTGEEKFVTLENEHLKIVFSNKGALMKSAELKNYVTSDSLPLILFDNDDNLTNLNFPTIDNRVINTRDLYFDITESGEQITLRITAGEGKYLEHRYAFDPQRRYVVNYTLHMVGFNDIIPRNANYISFFNSRKLRQVEKSKESENRYTAAFYKYKNDDVSNLSESGDDSESLSTSFTWVSFKQQFFNHTLIYPEGFTNGTVKSLENNDPGYLKTMEASFILPFRGSNDQQYAMSYFIGPNHYQTLRSLEIELESIVMVTGFMSWVSYINKWIIIPVFNWLEKYVSNYGFIIFFLTLLIKIVLFPLTYRSYKSMAMMRLLQPEITELKEKHKEDQQKFASEQWKLFQSAGVSPMGGCLPQLLQFPILIAMYYFFPTSIELRQESFLWATDLSTYDSIYNFPPGFTIPFYGDHVSLFTLLMTVTSILYAMTQTQFATGPASMKYMPYIFPIMLLGIFNSFPAALTYYYFLTNIISYAQQWVIKKFIIDEDALHKKIQENKKKPVKKSSWQQKLEDVARQQREAQKKKK